MTSITFLDPSLSLIHVPLHVYPHFVHSLLTILRQSPEFFNLSFTPTSISIICPQHVAKSLFVPIIANLRDVGATIEDGGFLCMQIDGEGICDGTRLLEITQPLAKAGVSILFITTYFSDYVLVAAKEIKKVRKVLLASGFAFEDLSQSYISASKTASPMLPSPAASPAPTRNFDDHLNFQFDEDVLESSVGSLASEHGVSTLQFLKQSKVPVTLSKETKLVMAGSRNDIFDHMEALTDLFLAKELPKFFSLTIAPETSPSLLLSSDLVPRFDSSKLLGVESNQSLIPITLDLRGLSGRGLGGCGIICSVVDELMQRTKSGDDELIMSYLSTVVTGNVLIREEDLDRLGPTEGCQIM